MITVKRIYEPVSPRDGWRVLVERLWPRGMSKQRAHVDQWLKEVAPSPALRTWFGHEVAKWPEFQRRYAAELQGKRTVIANLAHAARRGRVTFVFATQDQAHNSAVVLKRVVERHL